MQRTLLLREYKNGNYALMPWFASRVVSDAVFCVVFQHVNALLAVTSLSSESSLSSHLHTLALSLCGFSFIISRSHRTALLLVAAVVVVVVGASLAMRAARRMFLSIPVFFMVQFQFSVERFFVFVAAMVLTGLIGNALGLLVGATSKDLMMAQNKLMPTVIPLLLFSGFIIPKSSIKSYFIWLYYASFFQYAISAGVLCAAVILYIFTVLLPRSSVPEPSPLPPFPPLPRRPHPNIYNASAAAPRLDVPRVPSSHLRHLVAGLAMVRPFSS